MMTCIHTTEGLCPTCKSEYNVDPLAYIEFGQHPEGIRRWQEERAAQEAWYTEQNERAARERFPANNDAIPF